jgi:Protein of unknown function (DUF935)
MTINEKYARQRDVNTKDFGKVSADQQGMVINHVHVRPIQRKSADIGHWRAALTAAEQDHQQRSLIYDLFAEILLDGRLKQLITQRISRITNTPLTFKIDGKSVEDITKKLIPKMYFRQFLKYTMESIIWGHSLIEPVWPAAGTDLPGSTNIIPRKHVKPRYGIVTQNAWDVSGIAYREKPLSDTVIEAGDANDLGILLECAPYVIYKRGGMGDWAEFAETFGMPFRWATYNNPESRKVLESAMSQAGSAGFVVAPEGSNLEFHNPTSGSGNNDIFRFLLEACNNEMSVTVLGNTMTTTEAKHSGYAQSETQMKTQDEIHADDRAYVLCVLNEKLTPFLARLGYQVQGGEWSWGDGDGLSLQQRLAIDTVVAQHVPIGDQYWYSKYNIPVPDPSEIDDDEPDEPDEPEEKDTKPATRKKG